jgi:hypothetical protein
MPQWTLLEDHVRGFTRRYPGAVLRFEARGYGIS